jgi:threonine dehydrogenase-like Zn-dependent dehydrogenase
LALLCLALSINKVSSVFMQLPSIQRAVLYGKRDLRIVEETLPGPLGPNQLFVQTEVTALSTGTDLANYDGRSEELPNASAYPRGVGYSNVGIVKYVGPGVTRLSPGDRVFSTRPHQSGYLAQETDLLIKIDPRVDAEQASLAYLTHLGAAALRKVNYQPGESVLVIGLGVIGLCTVGLAASLGAGVEAVGNHPHRLDLARAMKAERAWDAATLDHSRLFGGRGADVIVLTANAWSAYRTALEGAAPSGRIALLGFPGRAQPQPDFNPLEAHWIYGKQLTIAGAGFAPRVECAPEEIRFNLRRSLEDILARLADRRLDFSPLISHRIGSSSMQDAYEMAIAHDKSLTAAVFRW